MKVWIFVPLAVLVVGCSGGKKDTPVPDAGNPAPKSASNTAPEPAEDGPKEVEKFGDDVFKVPPYPGATIMKFTSLEMNSDLSHSFNRHYKTMDSVDKVAEHYMSEGVKVGKLADTGITNKPGALMRVVIIEFGPKEKLQVQVMNIPKDNSTDISAHLIQSK